MEAYRGNYTQPSYGQAAKAARMQREMTQRQLSALSGVNVNTLSRLELDKSLDVRYWVVESLADALGMSVDSYMGHEVMKQ